MRSRVISTNCPGNPHIAALWTPDSSSVTCAQLLGAAFQPFLRGYQSQKLGCPFNLPFGGDFDAGRLVEPELACNLPDWRATRVLSFLMMAAESTTMALWTLGSEGHAGFDASSCNMRTARGTSGCCAWHTIHCASVAHKGSQILG